MDKPEERVLRTLPFGQGDHRFGGAVEVVERIFTNDEGTKKYIDLRLKIGERGRFVPIPRRPQSVKEIADALLEAAEIAGELYTQQARSQTTQARQEPSVIHRPRRDGQRRRDDDYNEYKDKEY